MNRAFPLAAAILALAASGCTYSSTTQAVAAGPPLSSAEQACIDYGFTPGTTAYGRCVSQQAQARVTYPVVQAYPESQLLTDARVACSSYGLIAATAAYERCLTNEMNARRYRDGVVYQPTASPVAYNPTTYAPTTTYATTGVQVYRDEYGFRYDAQGNRLDRYGNIISPYSTRP
jgi:hypothetical protein